MLTDDTTSVPALKTTDGQVSTATNSKFGSVFWSAAGVGGGPRLTRARYEEQALVFALQGLANRGTPRLFVDVGADDFDNPSSERAWRILLADATVGLAVGDTASQTPLSVFRMKSS